MAEDRTVYERIAIPLASSRPGSWFYVNLAPFLDRPMLRLSRGRLSTAGLGRVGLLKVRGARSGAEKQTPLVHTKDGDSILLVASRGGDVRHPAWYRNVIANPDVHYVCDGEERPYLARRARGRGAPARLAPRQPHLPRIHDLPEARRGAADPGDRPRAPLSRGQLAAS